MEHQTTCREACDILETVLKGTVREEILDEVQKAGTFKQSLKRLRSEMRSHTFKTASDQLVLDRLARDLDHRTREDGFYVLHAWHHVSHKFTNDNMPVLLLDFFVSKDVVPPHPRVSLSILLDNYFFHLLALCAMRAWDDGDPSENLQRISGLVRDLQGPRGSGHQFVEGSEALLIQASSQFHPEDSAYDALGEKLFLLDEEHRLHFARLSTAALAGHLRWGFAVMYKRDLGRMRKDNVADYPWLLLSLEVLMRGYARMHDEGVYGEARDDVVEGLLNGLTPDPWAFFGDEPSFLKPFQAEYDEFLELFAKYEDDLLEEFQLQRPSTDRFSPLNFHFNFPHNGMVALVMFALEEGRALDLPLDALMTREHEGEAETHPRSALAQQIMDYSGSSPEGLDAHGAVLVVHDALAGLRHFNMTLSAIKKHRPRTTQPS